VEGPPKREAAAYAVKKKRGDTVATGGAKGEELRPLFSERFWQVSNRKRRGAKTK